MPNSRAVMATLLFLVLSSTVSAKPNFTTVPSQSSVKFSLGHLAGRANGSFGKFQGVLSFSSAKPELASIQFSVDVATVDTANGTRDDNLRGEEYFGAKAHPKMTFVSKAFKKVGANQYMVTGALVIKGVSKNVSVPVTLTRSGTTWATGEETLHFKANFEIDRTEFGVGESSSLLGSIVTIALDLEFRGSK